MTASKHKNLSKSTDKSSTNYHLTLCTDVLRIVLSFLPAGEILKCSMVCKDWYHAKQDNFLWKEVFECRFGGGFLDFDSSRPFIEQYEDALARIKREQSFWIIEDEEFWNYLDFHQRQLLMAEYLKEYKKNYNDSNFGNALVNLSKRIRILEKFIHDLEQLSKSWRISLLKEKIGRAQLHLRMGYATLSANEALDVLSGIQQMISYSRYAELQGALYITRLHCTTVLIQSLKLKQEFDKIDKICKETFNLLDDIINLGIDENMKTIYIKYYIQFCKLQMDAVYQLQDWEKLAKSIDFHLKKADELEHQNKLQLCEEYRNEILQIVMHCPSKLKNLLKKEMSPKYENQMESLLAKNTELILSN